MMKSIKFLLIITILGCAKLLSAQNDEEQVNLDSLFPIDPYYYDLASDTCHTSEFSVQLIHYSSYTKAFISFSNANNIPFYYKLDGAATDFQYAAAANGNAVISNLTPDATYQLRLLNSCGNWVDAGVFSTTRDSSQMITVSNTFYNEIVKYLKQEELPFDTFLESLNTVSPYEKIAFIQQFFYKGAPFLIDEGTQLPTLPERGDGGRDTCFCNSIRTSQLAMPAQMDNVTGIISDYSQPGSGPNPVSLGGDSNTRTWFWMNNKGAAKWHNLWTEGFKSKKGVDYDRIISWNDSTYTSSQQSWLSITFLCLDGDRIPKACECEKDISFAYRYDTHVKAVAELRDGATGSKNSIAQVEDLAQVTYFSGPNNTDFKPLDLVKASAESYCDRAPNPEFWTNAAQAAANGGTLAIQVALATQGQDSTITAEEWEQILETLNAYYTSVATVINTPYHNQTNCDNDDENTGSISGKFDTVLIPNKPVSLVINSFSKLYAGGRRAWHSSARINSNFYLAAYIKHNALDGTPQHCCTPRMGLWVLGSCDGPRTNQDLRIDVAEFLYGSGLSNLTTTTVGNGRTVPRDFGFLWERSSLDECNKVIINPNTPGGSGRPSTGGRGITGRTDLMATGALGSASYLSIWDLSGKLLAEFNNKDFYGASMADIQQIVNTRLGHLSAGIYIARAMIDGQAYTQKIFIQ